MKKIIKVFVVMCVVALIGGVIGFQQLLWADYSIKGSGRSISEVFNGTISVVGNGNTIRVQPGSAVDCITLAGSDNTVQVEAGAAVRQIRGAGSGNVINAPDDLEIDLSLLKGTANHRQTQGRSNLDGL